MANVHMILQGKGGVGKSFIASLLAQHKTSDETKVLSIDTDPVNATFAGFKALNVKRLELMDGDVINARKFDDLIELIASSKTDIIIDNGASTFIALSHYLISNHIASMLKELGHTLVIHTVITGGQAFQDTLNGFNQLIKHFSSDVKIVVWLNPYWGNIIIEGKSFEELKVYQENKKKVSAIVRIPDFKEETFGEDLKEMLKERLTFNEAIPKKELTIMMRQRLKIISSQLFKQLDNLEAALS
jgi:anion-transporting  ArsA/GET3 family ATPase